MALTPLTSPLCDQHRRPRGVRQLPRRRHNRRQVLHQPAEAIGNSTMQGTVTVNGEHKVAAPIHFGNDLTIQGLTCGGKRCVCACVCVCVRVWICCFVHVP